MTMDYTPTPTTGDRPRPGGDTTDTGGEGTWSKPFEFPEGSGNWYIYNSTTYETKEYTEGPYGEQSPDQPSPTHLAPLLEDLANLGLIPQQGADIYGTLESARNTVISSPYKYDQFTWLWIDRATGKVAPEWVQNRGIGGGDPYAGAANSRAERGLQEQIRQNRIQEAMNAIDLQTMRQRASLAGAQFAAPTDTGGYFPQMGPESPLVRSGLADPMKFTPTPYNANISDEQIAKDLAMIRSRAGVG